MKKHHVALGLASAIVLAGCASADLGGNEPVKPEKQYLTGSNIPRHPGQMPDSVQTAVAPSDGSLSSGGSVPRPGPGGH